MARKPTAEQALARLRVQVERLALVEPRYARSLLLKMTHPELRTLDNAWGIWAHGGQVAPPGDWRVWLIRAGRGFGKTRAGAEWISQVARDSPKARIALVGATEEDVRRVMIEGEAGLMKVARAGEAVDYRRTTGEVRFQSGAVAAVFSAAAPEKLRGPEHQAAWCDELAKWRYSDAAWDNLMLGMRGGANPQTLVTTTPRNTALMLRVMTLSGLVETRGASRDNPHLPASFLAAMEEQYGGTHLARQELEGELVVDVVGALWSRAMIEGCRVAVCPDPAAGRDDLDRLGPRPRRLVRCIRDAHRPRPRDRFGRGSRADVGASRRGGFPFARRKARHAWARDRGRMRSALTAEREIADDEVRAEGSSRGKHGRAVAALETVPRLVTLAHYDPARDYQTGLQRALRPGAGNREDKVEMPAAIDASTAKTMAEAVLSRAEAGREKRTVSLGWVSLGITPGACVTIRDVPGLWRVTDWTLEHMVLLLGCVRLAAGTLPVAASAGRALPAPDVATGTTVLAAFEGLPLDDSLLTAPRLSIVAAGTAPGWRRAALLYSLDGGARWTAAGATATPGVIGTLVMVPGMAPAAVIDRASLFEVDLLHSDMALHNADAAALDAGANLALVGGEVLQFGSAEQIGLTRWRLGTLLRGRRGTEAVIGTQGIGDRFVLIEAESVLSLDLPIAAIGTEVRIMASGPGDVTGPVELTRPLPGTSIVPPAPVHLRWSETGDGDAAVTWIRRSRIGWRWIDRVDAPLGEERERYRTVLTQGDGTTRTIESESPALTVPAAQRIGGVMLAVRQIGSLGESPPAHLTIPA